MAKKKRKDVLAGRDPISQLYRGVRRYVQSKSGCIVVIGGIRIAEWSDEESARGKFSVVVDCMGRKPSLGKTGDAK